MFLNFPFTVLTVIYEGKATFCIDAVTFRARETFVLVHVNIISLRAADATAKREKKMAKY